MVVKPGSLKGIRGEGMPVKGNRFEKVRAVACLCVAARAHPPPASFFCFQGVLFIHYIVDMPTAAVLTPQVKEALATVLPPGPAVGEDTEEMEKCPLVEIDPDESFRATQRAGREAYDSDDDEGGRRRQGGVQCAHQ